MILQDEIRWRSKDKANLPRMLEIAFENIQRKIEMETQNISGEMLTYGDREVKKMLVNLLIKKLNKNDSNS